MRRSIPISPSCKIVVTGLLTAVLMLLFIGSPANAYGDDSLAAANLKAQEDGAASSYDATPYNVNYPGVYKVVVEPNAAESATTAPTINFPDLKDSALKDAPTDKSPAIICGTAVPFSDQENARQFTDPSARVAPYSYFKYAVDFVKEADGKTPKLDADGNKIPKLTGFDSTYYIVRIDASNLFKRPNGSQINKGDSDANEYYLHVQQAKNNALLVAIGQEGKTFSQLKTVGNNQVHYKVGSYNIGEMLDKDGADKETPYFDVILFSSASIVSGADAQKEGALNGDVELSFYVDKQAEKPEPAEKYDPQKQFSTTEEQTAYVESYFKKYYDEEDAVKAGAKISRFTVKGSELALETIVLDTSQKTSEEAAEVLSQPWKFWKMGNVPATFWSFSKSLAHAYYDTNPAAMNPEDMEYGNTIGLMIEVPVISSLNFEGASATELKKRTINVNSFDIQIANNKSTGEGDYTSGLTLKNGWLKIQDLNNTTGAELAIGNNATMKIDTGGKLIVDRSCQLEIEWDGATAQPATEGQQAAAPDVLNNGALNLEAGGEILNNGVITIEGTEGKPYQPGQEATTEQTKGHGEFTICADAKMVNNGCFMPNGALYVQGTLINNGKFYDDPLVSKDPDKGQFVYHRGIQCTWKDDITQKNIMFGGIYVGMDKNWATVNADKATLTNNGDILLCPGELVNEGTIKNMSGGHIYSCATDKAIVPIEPDPNNPTVVTKEVLLDGPKGGIIYNWATIDNQGTIQPAQVTVSTAGYLGEIVTPGNYPDFFTLVLSDSEKCKLTGTGYLYKHDLRNANVELVRNEYTVDSVVYDGSDQWFDVIATVGDTVYSGGKDFTVTCLDPNGADVAANKIVNAGAYKIVVKGANTFANSVTKTFTVEPAALTAAALDKTAFTYNAAVQKPNVTSVKAGSLTPGASGYTVAYSDANPKSAGTYQVTVTGKGNYTGSIIKPFKIEKAANPMKVTAKSAKAKKLKKKAKSVKAVSVTGAQGKVTYKIVKVKAKKKLLKQAKKKIKLAPGGKLKLKKKLKKGTYKVTLRVAASGNASYKPATKDVTVKVKVK